MVSCNRDLSQYPNIPEKFFGLPPVIASFFLLKRSGPSFYTQSPKKKHWKSMVQSLHLYMYIYIYSLWAKHTKHNATTFLKKYHEICFSPRCWKSSSMPSFCPSCQELQKKRLRSTKPPTVPSCWKKGGGFIKPRKPRSPRLNLKPGENWTGVLRCPFGISPPTKWSL